MVIKELKSVIQSSKKTLRDIIDEGKYYLNTSTYSPKSKILMYHGVDKYNSLEFNFRHIGAKYFDKHLACLKKHFSVVSLEDYSDHSLKTKKPKCVITFDDGYLNNLKYALPLLEKYNCSATIFVTAIREHDVDYLWSDMLDMICATSDGPLIWNNVKYYKHPKKWYQPYMDSKGHNLHSVIKKLDFEKKMTFFSQNQAKIQLLQKESKYEDYWKLLENSEIKHLANHPLITIGSHAVFHNNLALLPEDRAIQELKESKSYLERLTETAINSLAYPDGCYNQNLIYHARDIGYNFQLAVDYRNEEDRSNQLIEDRVGMYAYEPLNNQYQKILK